MDQNFDADNYCGVFHFKFWQFGHWVDIVIDDRLPTYNGKLVFMHSSDRNEFWSALLEKAYAKLCGSYESLKGGSTSEALEDFTGGLAEVFDLEEEPPSKLFKILMRAHERGSLIGCSIGADAQIYQKQLDNGLVAGHAYSITDVRKVGWHPSNLGFSIFCYMRPTGLSLMTVHVKTPSGKEGDMELIRVRNPWGNEAEWNGAWSDKSPQWTCLTSEERNEIGLVFAADGEFWMSIHDFLKCWHKVEVCHLNPEASEVVNTSVDSAQFIKHWHFVSYDGNWTKGATAGGCRNFLNNPPATFAYNPQYRVTLKDSDSDTDADCTCIVALMQKNRRKMNTAQGLGELLTIGFAVYKVDEDINLDEAPLDRNYFNSHVSVARTQNFMNLREVCCRFTLPIGTYVIVPSTFEPNEEGDFMLRIYSEKQCDLTECAEHTRYEPAPVNNMNTPLQPASEDLSSDRINDFFDQLAGDDFELDAWELQTVLTRALGKEFQFEQFSLDTCRSMIACVDMSRSGKLVLEEFKELWKVIRQWKTSFIRHRSNEQLNTISSFELKDALQTVGYHLHPRVLTVLALRYASKDGRISFDDFIGCAVKLKTMMDVYEERDPRNTGTASFDLDAWIELTMYA